MAKNCKVKLETLVEWARREHGLSRAQASMLARKGKIKDRFGIDCRFVGNTYIVLLWE